MSELDQDIQDQEIDIDQVDQTQDQELEFSDVELEAMEKGWNPDGAEGKRNLSAEEYLDRQPLYDKIHKAERSTRRMQEQYDALAEHLKMIQKNLNTQQIDELKREKLAALEEGEHNRVLEIDEKIIAAHQNTVDIPRAPDTTAFDTWVDSNSWYEQDDTLRLVADGLGQRLAAQNQGNLTAEHLQMIAQEVKQKFPDKFRVQRNRHGTVESASPSRQRPGEAKYTAKDLDADAQNVMRTLIRTGTYESEEAYINDLVKSGYFS